MPLSSPVTIVAKRNNRSVSRSARTGGTPANTRQSPSWAGCTDIGTLTLDDCKAGDRRCNGRTPEVCESSLGRWIKQPVCANGCFAGRCTECVPGSDKRSCDGNRVRVCGDDGRYTSGAACPNGCFNGACLPCTPGARTCHGTSPMVCNGRGQWQAEGAACASTGRCSVRPLIDGSRCYGGACAPGTATTCQGKTPVSCDAVGRLVIGKPCATACIAGACAQCSPGQRGCGKEGEPLACGDDGTWTPMGDKCPFACDQGACAGECQPGSKRCLENLRQSCNAQGRWVTEQICAFRCGESAGTTACAGECRPGQKACQGNLPRLCSEQRRSGPASRAARWPAARARVLGCDKAEARCEGNVPFTRDAQCNWVAGAPCPAGCWQGRCGPAPCFPMGSRKCEGNQVLLCNASGQYEPSESCAASCSAGTCTTCQPGARVCSERTLRTCSPWGEWDAGSDITGGLRGRDLPGRLGARWRRRRLWLAHLDGRTAGHPARQPGGATGNDRRRVPARPLPAGVGHRLWHRDRAGHAAGERGPLARRRALRVRHARRRRRAAGGRGIHQQGCGGQLRPDLSATGRGQLRLQR